MKQFLLAATVSVFSFALLAGCAEAPPPAAAEPAEIGSAGAVSTARRDAAANFQQVAVSTVNVSRSGRYWLVDLRSREGSGVHYAIATDGSIRERRVVQ